MDQSIRRSVVWRSLFRQPYPRDERSRAYAVMNNVFLHIHPVRVRQHAVKFAYTFCLGGLSFFFFLVLTVGWLFVSERRQGTLKRLRAAPLSRAEVLLGKTLPCFILSLAQGLFLLIAGRLVFGMRWGPAEWPFWQQALWILLVVLGSSVLGLLTSFVVSGFNLVHRLPVRFPAREKLIELSAAYHLYAKHWPGTLFAFGASLVAHRASSFREPFNSS
jgi:ABC-type Na+ efflux pump permease subunit